MAKKEKITLIRGEKLLYTFIVLLVIFNILGQAFSMTMLSKTNYDVERTKGKIVAQERTNDSLNMKINELASLENVETIASLYGLVYNNGNVKIIQNNEVENE
ncbi:MAG: hypothetical protein RR228_03975 [Bacilli bacterium]